jgi:hypothetical protein
VEEMRKQRVFLGFRGLKSLNGAFFISECSVVSVFGRRRRRRRRSFLGFKVLGLKAGIEHFHWATLLLLSEEEDKELRRGRRGREGFRV